MDIPLQFHHSRLNVGQRLPHWPDLNAAALAEHLQVGAYHLRLVLTGRRQGSKELMSRITHALETTPVEVKLAQKLSARHYGPARGRGTIGKRIKKQNKNQN